MAEFKPDKIMLNNYLQNKLNDSETEQLELWLSDYPDVMEELELSLMLKDGVSSLAINNLPEKIEHENSKANKYVWLTEWLKFPVLASVALFFGYYIGQNNLSDNIQGNPNNIYGNALLIDIETMRGEIKKPDAEIYLDNNKRPVVITLEVSSLSEKTAVAEILFANNREKIKVEVEFSYLGIASLFIGPENLEPGLLTINLREFDQAPIAKSLELEIKYN